MPPYMFISHITRERTLQIPNAQLSHQGGQYSPTMQETADNVKKLCCPSRDNEAGAVIREVLGKALLTESSIMLTDSAAAHACSATFALGSFCRKRRLTPQTPYYLSSTRRAKLGLYFSEICIDSILAILQIFTITFPCSRSP